MPEKRLSHGSPSRSVPFRRGDASFARTGGRHGRLPTLETATIYAGLCLVEGTNLSEGRSTTRPLERAGAPWLDARALAAQPAGWDLPGVIFRPVRVVPEFLRHAGAKRQGVQRHVAGRLAFRPVLAGGPGRR